LRCRLGGGERLDLGAIEAKSRLRALAEPHKWQLRLVLVDPAALAAEDAGNAVGVEELAAVRNNVAAKALGDPLCEAINQILIEESPRPRDLSDPPPGTTANRFYLATRSRRRRLSAPRSS